MSDEQDNNNTIRQALFSEGTSETDKQARFTLVQNLAEKGDPKDIPLLIELLSHKDLQLKFWTIQKLIDLGKPAIPLLQKATENSNASTRMFSAIALSHDDDADNIKYLIKLLKDEDVNVRASAIDALKHLRNKDAIKALEQVVAEDKGVTSWAGDALKDLASEAISYI